MTAPREDVVIYDEFPAQPQPYPGDLLTPGATDVPRFTDLAGAGLNGVLHARNERDETVPVSVLDGVLDDLPAGTYRLTGILRGPSGAHMIAETVTL